MKVLVTGGTGRVGRELVDQLQQRGASVRIFTRDQDSKSLPAGAEVAVGDLTNPDTVRTALQGVDKLFLLIGNVADELTQALLTYEVAREAKIQHITYLSVYQAERFPDVPHFIAKHTIETALKDFDVPFTILRPGYFFQNDVALKDLLTGPGIFPTPIGEAGLAAVDARDIAEAAAITLTTEGHAGKTYDLVSHTTLSGPGAAAIWSKVLGKPVTYPGVPVAAFEQQLRQFMPPWYAMDLRLMFQRYQERGFAPAPTDADAFAKLLGRAPRSYEQFAEEMAAAWR